jgi:hypothetical protein
MRRLHISKGEAMARERIHLRRVGGTRKSASRVGWRPVLFFVLLALVTILGITREDALRKLAPAQLYSNQDERH